MDGKKVKPASDSQTGIIGVSVYSEPDLAAVAAKWIAAVSAHRGRAGSFGSVKTNLIETPTELQLHLIEETTFKAKQKPSKLDECPLQVALKFMAIRVSERSSSGVSGSVKIESDQVAGKFTFAKVIELTIISVKRPERLDGTRVKL